MLNTKYYNSIIAVISIILYFFTAYFLDRTEFYTLVFLWFSLFGCSYYLWKKNQSNFQLLVGFSILFRLIFLFAIPNLSQDFYRFIWDGRMLLTGLNPYLSLPETFIEFRSLPIPQAEELYEGMGAMNGSHYTNYPPINQLCFFIAALFGYKSILASVVTMRVLIILADIGIIYFGKKLLELLKLPTQNIFLYALNPFIIIELTGNLHFESVMLFFLIWSLYALAKNKWILAAVLLACSVSVKLIPLLFLPLFFKQFISLKKTNLKQFYKLIAFYAIVLVSVGLMFLPFYSNTLLANYSNSVGLWFKNFEFNASIYYILRAIGYLFRGYNEIAIIGKISPIATIIVLLIFTFFRKQAKFTQLLTSMLLALSFYYFTTTTMHPWYIATLLILSVFTKYRFPLVWSIAIILSYQAYANTPWKENLWFVALEYFIVYGFLIWELSIKNKPTQ